MLMYHATDFDNLWSILENGIKASFEGGVYLTDQPQTAATFVALRGMERIVAIPVEVDYVIETFDHDPRLFKCRAYMTTCDISADQIVIDEIVTFENPFYRKIMEAQEEVGIHR